MNKSIDTITISALEVTCIIGVNPWERVTPQPLEVGITLERDIRLAARSGCLADTIDYSAMDRVVTFILQAGGFRLLETAAEAIASALFGMLPRDVPPESVTVTLTKPLAFGGNGRVAMKIERTAQDFVHPSRVLGQMVLTELYLHPEFALQCLSLDPGAEGITADGIGVDAIFATTAGLTMIELTIPQYQIITVTNRTPARIKNPTSLKGQWLAAGRLGQSR